MHNRIKFIVSAAVIATAIGYLIVTAVRNTAEYYMTVNEVKARQTQLEGQSLRIAGRVKPGTISWNPATLTLTFAIVQPSTAGAQSAASGAVRPVASQTAPYFDVISRGEPKPDMFAPGRDVIVEGKLDQNGVVQATQVLTSCPSKYVPKQPR